MSNSHNESLSVVILGGNGFLGRNVIRLLPQFYSSNSIQLYSSSRNLVRDQKLNRDFNLGFNGSSVAWIEDVKLFLRQLVEGKKRAVVLNLVAIANHVDCNRDPSLAYKTNFEFAADYATFCKSLGIPFVHVSTDALHAMDSSSPVAPAYYRVADAKKLDSIYAETKSKAEDFLMELDWGHCVRLSFVGDSLGTHRGLISFLAQSIVKKAEISGFIDNWFTPLHTHQFASRLADFINNGDVFTLKSSLYQWATQKALTKYDFLRKTLDYAGFEGLGVSQKKRADFESKGSYVLDQSMWDERGSSTEEMIRLSAQSLRRELELLQGI